MPERVFDDNLIDSRSLPHDVDSERALLALCLKHPSNLNDIVSRKLVSKDFYDSRNATIFESITRLYLNNANVDPYTVNQELTKSGLIDKAGGNAYVITLTDAYAIASNIDDYVSIVREKSKLRQIINAFDDMKNQAYSNTSDVNTIVDLTIGRFSTLRDAPEGIGFESLKSILKQNITQIQGIASGKIKEKVIKTSFRGLDYKLGGFRPGTLNIIAARPGMGKTALVINIATNVAKNSNTNVNIFSLEMSKQEIGNRIISSATSTTAKKLQEASMSQDEILNVARACGSLGNLPIYIDDHSDVNPITMLSACKELKAQNRLGLIIVDYLQLMSMPSKGSNYSRQNEISDISRNLKIMAKELNVPIIALSQLSRGSERRDDHTPMLSDLRDSGAIEQDADSVIFIDRDAYYDKEKNMEDIQDAKLIVAKNRHGETGIVKLKWQGSKTLFFEEDRPSDPVEGYVSPYSRTILPDASASDYSFDDSYVPEEIPDPVPPAEVNENMSAYQGEDLPFDPDYTNDTESSLNISRDVNQTSGTDYDNSDSNTTDRDNVTIDAENTDDGDDDFSRDQLATEFPEGMF